MTSYFPKEASSILELSNEIETSMTVTKFSYIISADSKSIRSNDEKFKNEFIRLYNDMIISKPFRINNKPLTYGDGNLYIVDIIFEPSQVHEGEVQYVQIAIDSKYIMIDLKKYKINDSSIYNFLRTYFEDNVQSIEYLHFSELMMLVG